MAKAKQEFKTTKKLNEDVLKEVVAIKEQYGLTAENLIEVAKDKKSALHPLFEWNDKVAGHQFRLAQARMFINEIKVVIDEQEVYAFENVRVGTNGDSERQYLEVSEIMSSKELKQQVLSVAISQINYWKAKYEKYKEFKPIVKAVEEVNKKWRKN